MIDDDRDFDDDDSDEEEATSSERSSRSEGRTAKAFSDFARKALMTGIGAVFMTEDSLRSQLSEMKLPKEAMGAVINTADKTKKEIIEVVARETRAFLSHLEVEQMVGRILTGTTIEITTKIRILPKEGGGVSYSVEENDTALVKTDKDGIGDTPAKDDAQPERRSKRKRAKES